MPKTVLPSGTSTTAAAAPAAKPVPTPAPQPAVAPSTDPLKLMEKRLRDMNLDEETIKMALSKERERLAKLAPAAKAQITPAPVTPKPADTVAPAPKPAPVEKPAEKPSDEQFASQLQESFAEGEDPHAGGGMELEPEAPVSQPERPAQSTALSPTGAAPDTAHDEEEMVGTVAVRNKWSDSSDGAISGPIDRSDFKTPQLKIVQGSGKLSQKFNQGALIFMDLQIFAPPDPDKPGPPIQFIPVSVQKYFRENLSKEDQDAAKAAGLDLQPRSAFTTEDVQKLGGTLDFSVDGAGKRVKPTWAPAARCVVLIERPEGCEHPGFVQALEIEGKERFFAPAIMFVNGGQYRAFVKPIIDATNFILCEGTGVARKIVLEKRVWKLQVVKEKSGDNMVFNPKVTMLPEMTNADLRAYAISLRGA